MRAQGRAAVIGISQGEGGMVKEREEGSLGGVKRRCLQSFGGVGLAREGGALGTRSVHTFTLFTLLPRHPPQKFGITTTTSLSSFCSSKNHCEWRRMMIDMTRNVQVRGGGVHTKFTLSLGLAREG